MEEAEEIGYLNFNQDGDCFACSTASGFRVYNTDPVTQTIRRDLEGVEVSIVEMVFRSNLFALVASTTSPLFAPNKVIIWDDEQNLRIGELTFRSEVRSVRLRRDRVVVALEQKVHVFNFNDLRFVKEIETFSNRKGICAISTATNMFALACPGKHRAGEVCLELFNLDRTIYIQAHHSPLACLALSQDGRLLATASTKGTIIRIFDTNNGNKLQELRRGTERADILSMAISPTCHWLALSSDKGTVHVFSLVKSLGPFGYRMVSSFLSFASNSSSLVRGAYIFCIFMFLYRTVFAVLGGAGVIPSYLSSDCSFAQFRIPENTKSIVAFGSPKDRLIVLCNNGRYYKCSYDLHRGGDMTITESARFT